MTDIAFTSSIIRPPRSHGANVVQVLAADAITVGEAVYPATAQGWRRAAANVDAATARTQGIAVESFNGLDAINARDIFYVCTWGPITGFVGLIPGGIYYQSDTPGCISDVPGTYGRIVGHGLKLSTEVCLWLDIQQNDPVAA